MAPKEYNGHRSWNAWNVALWIGNDEYLYRHAMDTVRAYEGNLRAAAHNMIHFLPQRTPDGARYNFLSVKLALEGLTE